MAPKKVKLATHCKYTHHYLEDYPDGAIEAEDVPEYCPDVPKLDDVPVFRGRQVRLLRGIRLVEPCVVLTHDHFRFM